MLELLSRKKANRISTNIKEKIEKKWSRVTGIVSEYEKKIYEWRIDKEEALKEGRDIPLEPKQPNYASFKMDCMGGAFYNISGSPIQQKTLKREIGLMNRQVQLAGYEDGKGRDNKVFLPLNILEKVKNIVIQIENEVELVAKVTISIDQEFDISVNVTKE